MSDGAGDEVVLVLNKQHAVEFHSVFFAPGTTSSRTSKTILDGRHGEVATVMSVGDFDALGNSCRDSSFDSGGN